MKFISFCCAFVLLSTQCNSRSILDMESELSGHAASSVRPIDPNNQYRRYPPNIFIGAPSPMPRLEVTTDVYQRIANNIAEKLTTPIYRWFGIKSVKNPNVDDPSIDILTRREEPLESEIRIFNNDHEKITNRRSFTIPPIGKLKRFSTRAPKERKNYLNDSAVLKLIQEEDAAKGKNQNQETNTIQETTIVENYESPTTDKNNLILKFIEEIKNKYKEVTTQNNPADNNDYNNIIKNPLRDVYYEKPNDNNDKDKKDENSNSVDNESKNVENYLNNGGEAGNREDASINVENNKESVEHMLKYLLNIKPSNITNQLNGSFSDINSLNVTNNTNANTFNEVPFNLSTVFDIPSTLTTRFLKIRVYNDDEFDELAPDEGKEITFISILELIGSAFQVAFGAIASIFGKRKGQS